MTDIEIEFADATLHGRGRFLLGGDAELVSMTVDDDGTAISHERAATVAIDLLEGKLLYNDGREGMIEPAVYVVTPLGMFKEIEPDEAAAE